MQREREYPILYMYTILSKEVWKSNFQQYGEMEKQRWEQSEKRREQRRERVRKSEKE
jgi:hypothetical protein